MMATFYARRDTAIAPANLSETILPSLSALTPLLHPARALKTMCKQRSGSTDQTKWESGGSMADAAAHGHEGHDDRGFFTRWFMSTNHKDIGVLYLFTSGFVGFIAVAFTVYMRMELMYPGVQYLC